MLKDIEIPLGTTSRNKAPKVSVGNKLAEIARKPNMRPRHMRELGYVSFGLPYVDGITVEFTDDETEMSINKFNIGDKDLIGHGIGSRLLRRAIEYGMECHPKLERVVHAGANLAVVNTIVSVVGEDYVTVSNLGEHYGFGTERPLDSMFDDRPYRPEYPYFVDRVVATLDREAWSGKQS